MRHLLPSDTEHSAYASPVVPTAGTEPLDPVFVQSERAWTARAMPLRRLARYSAPVRPSQLPAYMCVWFRQDFHRRRSS